MRPFTFIEAGFVDASDQRNQFEQAPASEDQDSIMSDFEGIV